MDSSLKYVQEYRDRSGKVRRYLRRPGQPAIPLLWEPGSPKFIDAYQAALKGLPALAQERAKKQIAQLEAAQTKPGPQVGVYLLFLGDDLVYIGSSTNMPARVAAHRTNGRSFDRAYFIATKISERGTVERLLIKTFRPSQNRI